MAGQSERAPESIDLQTLTFGQLAKAAELAAKTFQERSTPDGRVEYFSATDRLGIPTASIYRGDGGKYYIYFQPAFGCVVTGSFDTVEEAKEALIKQVFIPNGYRVL